MRRENWDGGKVENKGRRKEKIETDGKRKERESRPMKKG